MEADPLAQLHAVADRMRALKPNTEASVYYELMSDALVWSDEIPDPGPEDLRNFQCLRLVLRYRTTLVMGSADERYQCYWEEAIKLFPSWPGFDPRRRSAEFRPVYEQLRTQARADIRELFDKPTPQP